jgi:lysozyme family protein
VADFWGIIPSIKKAEGGLSRDLDDNASSNPAPCTYAGQTGWHTNKGVTWSTFKGLAPSLGYTADCATFFAMPDDVWLKIFKQGYWDKMQGDKLKSTGIAYILAQMAWGSGAGTWSGTSGARPQVRNFVKSALGTTITSDSQMISVLNAVKDIPSFINSLIDFRINWLKGHEDWWKYGKGWTARYEELRTLALSITAEVKKKSTGI